MTPEVSSSSDSGYPRSKVSPEALGMRPNSQQRRLHQGKRRSRTPPSSALTRSPAFTGQPPRLQPARNSQGPSRGRGRPPPPSICPEKSLPSAVPSPERPHHDARQRHVPAL